MAEQNLKEPTEQEASASADVKRVEPVDVKPPEASAEAVEVEPVGEGDTREIELADEAQVEKIEPVQIELAEEAGVSEPLPAETKGKPKSEPREKEGAGGAEKPEKVVVEDFEPTHEPVKALPAPDEDDKGSETTYRDNMPLAGIISLGLLIFTLLVVFSYGNRTENFELLHFRFFSLALGSAWTILALFGAFYQASEAARTSRASDLPLKWKKRYEQALVTFGGLGLFLAVPAFVTDLEFGPFSAALLIAAAQLYLLAKGTIPAHNRTPSALLTAGAILLGPGLWLADGEASLTGLALLAGGGLVLVGGAALRHSNDSYNMWVLGAVSLAGLTGLQAGEVGYAGGHLLAAAGGGLLIIGALLIDRWRSVELDQRNRALEAGEKALNEKRPVEALAQLDLAFKLAARDGVLMEEPRFWALRGSALAAQRKYRRAMLYIGVALELDPDDETIWFERGRLFATLKRWEGAVECYSRAVTLSHDYLEAWLALGEAQLSKRANQEALSAFTRVTKLAPRRVKGWLGVGRAHAAKGEVRLAVQAFDTAIRLDPENLAPYKAKAKVYYTLKLWEKAEQAYEMVVHLQPKSTDSWWKLAGCYLELRNNQMALMALNNFTELKPKDVEGYLRRAALHFDEGEYGEAISDVHLALDLEPENQRATKLKEIVLSRLSGSGGWQ